MFAKLLRHEWRATRGIVALLCGIILISGVTIGAVMNHMIGVSSTGNRIVTDETTVFAEAAMTNLEEVACVLLLMAGIIAIAICCAASLFYVIYRFYKRCFTDEGYLTFTLPVTNHQILLSSITNCILSEIVVFFTAAVAGAIIGGMFLLAISQEQQIIWADLWVNWGEVWQQLKESFLKNLNRFLLVGFSGIAGALGELIVLMLAVTIGALIARKHKILAAVGVYYGISMVQSFVMSALMVGTAATQNVHSLLASPGVMGVFLSIGGYFLMHWLTSRKLNLT